MSKTAPASPSCNTGGKLQNKVLIDYLRFTFHATESLEKVIRSIANYFQLLTDVDITIQPRYRGFLNYSESWEIFAHTAKSEKTKIATYAHGGTTTNGTHCVDITGHGCTFVKCWQTTYAMLQSLDAKITRCDVAADFLDGQVTQSEFESLYFEGTFATGGRKPKYRYIESGTHDNRASGGKTFEVGSRKSGKLCRAYEKGKQLGDADSPWLRIEVELLAKDRVIPHEVLLNPAAYFVGSYKVFEQFVHVASERIKTIAKKANHDIESKLNWLETAAGKIINQLMSCKFDENAEDLVKRVRIRAVPPSLYSTVAAATATGAGTNAPFDKGNHYVTGIRSLAQH